MSIDLEEESTKALRGYGDKGSPSTRVALLRAGCILASEFCERMAFYSIDANLVLLLKHMGMSGGDATMLSLFWKGTGYITPLFGGWVADSLLGRFKTILMFVICYVVSMGLLTLGVYLQASQAWLVYVALFMVAIFMGGIKSNVVTFGADQFTHASENAKQSFFNWFYFSINVGSMISFTAIAYLQSYDFVIGLGVPALVMFVSAIFFFLGSSWYNKFPPAGSTLSKILSILYYCFTASPDIKRDAPSFLDRAKHVKNIQGFMLFEEEEVDDVKSLARLLPIFSTFIIFWCLYAQMSSVMLIQGVVMRLEIFPNFSIPPATLQAFNSAGILILLPLFDRVIYPCLRRLSISFSPLRRIGIGYLFATLAIFYAGGIEVWRISYLRAGNVLTQHINGVPTEAANLSVLYQIPAFLGIGIGEVFASVTGLEFAYSQAPSKMKSMVQAINMLTIALGNYFGTLVVFIVNAASAPHPWITDDPNESHMDLYFFTLTVLGILNIYYFIWLSSKWSD